MKKSRMTLPYLEKYDETITHPLSLRHASLYFLSYWKLECSDKKKALVGERKGSKIDAPATLPDPKMYDETTVKTRRALAPTSYKTQLGARPYPENVWRRDGAHSKRTLLASNNSDPTGKA